MYLVRSAVTLMFRRAVLPGTVVAAATVLFLLAGRAENQLAPAAPTQVGWKTNGPGVYRLVTALQTNRIPNLYWSGTNDIEIDTNRVPPAIAARIRERRKNQYLTNVVTLTNAEFAYFLPGSLNCTVWTNLIALTNGRNLALWSTRVHPPGWPTNAGPVVKWNPSCVAWGMKGLTALSPCWEQEGYSGQAPVTALTRRHGYTRGHGMGDDGFRTNYRGKKVWFVALDDTLVEIQIAREVVRTAATGKGDYTIVLFKKELPKSIQPVRVISAADMFSKYKAGIGAPYVMFCTEQGGNVSTGVAGFSVPTYKGGDSGCPNLLPLPGELAFQGGRSTSPPSREMQADMDELCRLEGVDARQYQMQWVDLSDYPSY